MNVVSEKKHLLHLRPTQIKKLPRLLYRTAFSNAEVTITLYKQVLSVLIFTI